VKLACGRSYHARLRGSGESRIRSLLVVAVDRRVFKIEHQRMRGADLSACRRLVPSASCQAASQSAVPARRSIVSQTGCRCLSLNPKKQDADDVTSHYRAA